MTWQPLFRACSLCTAHHLHFLLAQTSFTYKAQILLPLENNNTKQYCSWMHITSPFEIPLPSQLLLYTFSPPGSKCCPNGHPLIDHLPLCPRSVHKTRCRRILRLPSLQRLPRCHPQLLLHSPQLHLLHLSPGIARNTIHEPHASIKPFVPCKSFLDPLLDVFFSDFGSICYCIRYCDSF